MGTGFMFHGAVSISGLYLSSPVSISRLSPQPVSGAPGGCRGFTGPLPPPLWMSVQGYSIDKAVRHTGRIASLAQSGGFVKNGFAFGHADGLSR